MMTEMHAAHMPVLRRSGSRLASQVHASFLRAAKGVSTEDTEAGGRTEHFTDKLSKMTRGLREDMLDDDGVGPTKSWWDFVRTAAVDVHQRVWGFAEAVFPMRKGISEVRHRFGYGFAAYFTFCSRLVWLNLAVFMLWFFLVVLPWWVNHEAEGLEVDFGDTMAHFIGAKGIVSNDTSWFYYSGYYPRMGGSNTAAFYTIAIFTTYLLQCVLMILVIGRKIGRVQISAYDPNMSVAQSVYGYDMSVCDPKSMRSIRREIANEIDAVEGIAFRLNRAVSIQKQAEQNGGGPCSLSHQTGKRILGASLTCVVLVGSCAGLYFIFERSDSLNSTFPYGATLLASCVMSASPFLIRQIVHLEEYTNPKVHMLNNMMRIYAVKMANVGFFMHRVYYNSLDDPTRCVETETGSVLLQLVLMDLVVTVVLYGAFNIIRRRIYNWRNHTPAQFLLADNLLELVYAQSLVWIGSVVCPMMPCVAAIAFLLRFFGKKHILLYSFRRPTLGSQLRSADDVSFFNTLLLFTLLLCFLPIGYFMQRSSEACGPHLNSTPIDGADLLGEEFGPVSDLLVLLFRPFTLLFLNMAILAGLFLTCKHKRRAEQLHRLHFEMKDHESRHYRVLLRNAARRRSEQTALLRLQPHLAAALGGGGGRGGSGGGDSDDVAYRGGLLGVGGGGRCSAGAHAEHAASAGTSDDDDEEAAVVTEVGGGEGAEEVEETLSDNEVHSFEHAARRVSFAEHGGRGGRSSPKGSNKGGAAAQNARSSSAGARAGGGGGGGGSGGGGGGGSDDQQLNPLKPAFSVALTQIMQTYRTDGDDEENAT